MSDQVSTVFDHIPKTPQGHFVLYFYAAVFRLINWMQVVSDMNGSSLEDVFKRYPFIGEYYNEMHGYLPKDINWKDANKWWEQAITEWERSTDERLPIRFLETDAELNFDRRLAFIAIGLVEEDSRFGTLMSDMQTPSGHRRPSLEFIGQMIASGQKMQDSEEPWNLCRPLVDMGLVQVLNEQSARAEWYLRVPLLIWDAARGEVSKHPASWCRFYDKQLSEEIDELIYPAELLAQLKNVPQLVAQSKVTQLVLRSDSGGDTVEVLVALAASMQLNMIVARTNAETSDEVVSLLGPLCAMSGSLPVLQYQTGPGDKIDVPILKGYHGLVCFTLGTEGGIESQRTEKILTLSLQRPDRQLRKRFWKRALNGTPSQDIDVISDRFHLSGGYIKELANVAIANAGLQGRDSVRLDDVQQASRVLNRQQLDTLADRLTNQGNWHELVVSASTSKKLYELERRCRYRESLTSNLGPGFGNSVNQGVRALFTGSSGTGKTLAARILAAELGMDLYRVDLAAVINKYIGETEKNLHQVLAQAEALDVILLLDEGDGLLGGRTDIRSSNDRYANLETNYLLQRLENYQGIVLITSNLVENIDRAFQRRMDVLVPFYAPQSEQRKQILELHLPDDHQVDEDYLHQVAIRCALNGGQIRNTTMHACMLAIEDNAAVNRYHLEQALKSEYRKAGAISPLETRLPGSHRDAGMDAFINALSSQQ